MEIKREVEPGRRRRRHSAEFKARLIVQCRRPGLSMAAVALANGVNANLLRNWVVGRGVGASARHQQSTAVKEEFIALPLTGAASSGSDIRIELRRGATTVSFVWPASSAAQCAAWLRGWLG